MSHNRSRRVIIDDDEEMPGSSQGRRRRVIRDFDDDISISTQTQKSQRRKRNKSLSQNNSRNDDDDNQSQISQSRSQRGLSEDELNRLMGNVVRYILVSDRSRYPIQRQNIQKNILNGSKHYRSIMDLAATTLKKV